MFFFRRYYIPLSHSSYLFSGYNTSSSREPSLSSYNEFQSFHWQVEGQSSESVTSVTHLSQRLQLASELLNALKQCY